MLKLAVLASGLGSNFEAIQRHINDGRIQAETALLLTNNPQAPAIRIAEKFGIPVWAEAHTQYSSREKFDQVMLQAMRNAGVEAVVLAGYMRLLSPSFIEAYKGKILNIHPSLLPAFAGLDGVGETLSYGAKFAGCTVHFVTDDMDGGPIIIQAVLPVFDGENREALLARIHTLEHRIYPQAVQWFVQGRLKVEKRKVRVLQGTTDLDHGVPQKADSGVLFSPPLETGF